MPNQRVLARECRSLAVDVAVELLHNEFHEARLTALLILVDRFQRSKEVTERTALAQRYLAELDHVNNWDLVDLSAPKILGVWLLERPRGERSLLRSLAGSGHLWRQRIAILATLAFIRVDEFDDTLALADLLLRHEHDLIHKAVGWMLREVGKRDIDAELQFIGPRYRQMPRTMLRYAIEKLEPSLRKDYLGGRV